jgi:hypothetical protein
LHIKDSSVPSTGPNGMLASSKPKFDEENISSLAIKVPRPPNISPPKMHIAYVFPKKLNKLE